MPHFADSPQRAATPPVRARVVTYNVHGCVGPGGKLDVGRVADVLAAIEPDVVVLQELDVGRSRSRRCHQPETIAKRLAMSFLFCPTVMDGDEHYGHAVLSRVPQKHVRAERLPGATWPRVTEPRSALWTEIAFDNCTLHVIGTHLGLMPWERRLQAAALVSSEWMGDPRFTGPRVLCGDFNVPPGSRTYRKLISGLRDVQKTARRARERPTFPAWFPLLRIDHVLVSEEIRVEHADVVRTPLARKASDHLPVVVDLAFGAPNQQNKEMLP